MTSVTPPKTKFKRLDGDISVLVLPAVYGFELQGQVRYAVTKLRILRAVPLLIDRAREMKVEQAVLLTSDLIELVFDLAGAGTTLIGVMSCSGLQRRAKPIADGLGLLDLGEMGYDLGFNLRLAEP